MALLVAQGLAGQPVGLLFGIPHLIGQHKTTQVGNILAQRLFTVGLYAGQLLQLVVTIDHLLLLLKELGFVVGRPPVGLPAYGIVCSSLVVEAMCHLVTKDHEGCIAHGAILVGGEKRITEKNRENDKLVGARIIECIQSFERRPVGTYQQVLPLILLGSFSSQHVTQIDVRLLFVLHQVFHRCLARHLEVCVEGGFGYDIKSHGLQLLYGLGFSGCTQPVEILNALCEERSHLLQHLESTLTVGVAIEHGYLIVEEHRLSLCAHI